jgi:uncharacterized membrane protein
MLIAANLLPPSLGYPLWLVLVFVSALALRYADWRALWQVPARVHLVLGGVLFCLCLWLLPVRLMEGVHVHLLGMTCLTLVLGWCFALLAGSLALVLQTLVAGESAAAIPLAWLVTVAVPATVSRLLVRRLRRLTWTNLFVYLLGAGFAGGMLAMLAAALVALPLLWLAGLDEPVRHALANWPMIFLFLFPEGFINGMVVTTLAVFFPQWVKTFDDDFYLGSDGDQR